MLAGYSGYREAPDASGAAIAGEECNRKIAAFPTR
jgi:hypothetical protein